MLLARFARPAAVGLIVALAVSAGFLAGQARLNTIWAPVVAALGAAFLTAAAAIGVEEVRERHELQHERQHLRRDAYGQMVRASHGFVMAATTLRESEG
jgi:predicted tellurium resistance membrane protein TerC